MAFILTWGQYRIHGMTGVAWGEYIRSAQWNGETFNRAYINHDELVRVGALEFQMTSAPNYQ